jgi:nucleotide-binding universal stress UspA family protein
MSDVPRTGPIVVGVDGSPNSRRAVGLAAQLAAATGLPVLAVHAMGLLTETETGKVPSATHRAELEERLRTEWCQPLGDGDGGVENWKCRVVDGNPADVLLHTADEEGAAYIVVGSRGVGGHPDLMLGSTSHQVIQHTPCPAVVVPPPGRSLHT